MKPKCLSCGRQLRQHCKTVWEDRPRSEWKPPKSCRFNPDPYGEGPVCGCTEFELLDSGLFECAECGETTDRKRNTRRIVSRELVKIGDYGDGLFCGLNCGYNWAVANARR
jgi:hypothetical protein